MPQVDAHVYSDTFYTKLSLSRSPSKELGSQCFDRQACVDVPSPAVEYTVRWRRVKLTVCKTSGYQTLSRVPVLEKKPGEFHGVNMCFHHASQGLSPKKSLQQQDCKKLAAKW